MDALPDELLLAVLGHVDDGRSMLDAVPLVCKRWRRLSRDRRAWAGVDLNIHFRESRFSGALFIWPPEDHRFLLRAPALRCLKIWISPKEDFNTQVPKSWTVELGSILRRVSARITSLSLDTGNDSSFLQLGVDEFAALVERNQEWLRCVIITVESRLVGYNLPQHADLSKLKVTSLHAALLGCSKLRVLQAPPSVVSVLDRLPHLVELVLVVQHKAPRPGGDWSTWSLPRLRLLQYDYALDSADTDYYWNGELLLALCRAAPGLTRLEVTCGHVDEECKCLCLDGFLPVARALLHVPCLHRLDAHGGLELLEALQELSSLKKATVIVTCDMFNTSVVSRLLVQLEVQRPDLALKVTVKANKPLVTLKLGDYAESDED